MRGIPRTGFTPAARCVYDELGPLEAVVFGVVWRLGQQSSGGDRCVAPLALIAAASGLRSTAVRKRISALIETGYIVRSRGLVVSRSVLDPSDPELAAVIDSDRAEGFGRCVSCDQLATTIDHIVPRGRGGKDDPENLQPMCATCNSDKGTLTMEEWVGAS